MSGLSPALVPSHIFGVTVDSARAKHVHTLEDGNIAYLAGHNVVVYNPQTKQQRFLHGSRANEKSSSTTLGSQRSVSNLLGPSSPSSSSGPLTRLDITAIAVSPNKRFIAVAERGERASILIYDARTLKKKKLLSTSECASREYLSLCFSSDGKCLLSLSGAPGFSLINWQWEAVKPLDAIKLEFRDKPSERDSAANLSLQVSLSPAGDVAFVTGNKIVQAFRIDSASDFTFKPETVAVAFDNGSLEDGQCLSDLHFAGHCWVGDQIVMASDKGDLLLLEGLTKLSALPSHRGWGIRAIEPLGAAGGFLVGGQEGTVRVYEKQDSAAAAPFACARSYRIDGSRHEAAAVVSMAVSDGQDSLVFTTANQQLYRIASIDTEARPEHAHTELLSDPFHAGEVTGLDVCVRKPLMVTCGADRTVRVWNFLERSLVMQKTFQETPLSVALHPSGLHLLVGFTDKLRIMNLLMDDMRAFKELPVKNCGECRFSHGGQSFAAVMGSVIVVYSFYSCEILHTLRGHNGLVRSVYWTLDDSGIISAGMDGAVYERRLDEAHRRQEWVQKSCHYSSAVSSVDGKLYAVGDDRFLKEIQEGTVNKEMDAGVVLTQVAISHPPQRMLFVATESGFVRSFKFPLTGEFTDFVGHCGPVIRMSISPDDGFVFTTGADGCVCVFEVKERDGRLAKRDRADALPYAQEVLVTKTDLEEKTALMSDLKTQVEELTIHNAYQLRMHDIQFQDKLKEVTDQFNMQLEHNKSKYEMLKDERQDSEMDLEERVRTRAEQQALELQELDNKHQITLMDAVKRYHRLEAISAKENRESEELTRTREQQHAEALARNEAEFQSRLEAMRSENTRLGSDRDLVSRKFTETRSQLEEDIDKEIEELKRKYEAKLHAERDATLRLKGENGIMKKKFSALKKDIEDQREEIKTMMEKEAQLQQHIETLEREIQAHKQQIEERDVTIGDKETEIYDLKKENQELEKFKFVLDYQIKELKRQIEPRENEIEGMKDSVMRLDQELEQFHGENRELQSVVAQLKADLLAKHALSRKLRQQHRRILGALDALKNDIEATVRFLQDPNVLRDRVIALVSKHVTEDLKQNQAADPAVVAEYERQKQHLERTVATLKRDMESQTAERKKENTRILQENVALLKEINDLRKEMKNMRLAWKQNELKANMSSLHSSSVDPDEKELEKMLELQREQIRALEGQVHEQEALATLSSGRLSASKLANKVVSRERLLPMDDFAVPAHSLAS